MTDKEPVCAYVAATNSDAHLIATFLLDHGIKAHAVEDNSPAGMFSLGTLPELFRPKVFVDPDCVEAAAEIISRYEKGELQAVSPSVYCYHCGAECQIESSECAACGNELDLDSDGHSTEAAEAQAFDENSALTDFRSMKKPIATAMIAPFLFIIAMGITLALKGCLEFY